MANYTQTLSATQNFTGNLFVLRWYFGSFKITSAGKLRAVSRGISNFITFKQNLK